MRRRLCLPLLAAALLAVPAASAQANHRPPVLLTPNTDALVSIPGFGHQNPVSADGSKILVVTGKKHVLEDGDSSPDLYELSGGTYKLVSDRVKAGPDEEESALLARATADGSVVLFTTVEQITAEDTDNSSDVYRRAGGVTTLVSDRVQNAADESTSAVFAGMTPDASRVYFVTTEAIVAGDIDAFQDLYEWTSTGTTLISDLPDPDADAAQHASSAGGVVSTDGSRVFFQTREALLPADDTDMKNDVYRRDSNGTFTLLTDRFTATPDGDVDVSGLGSFTSADGSRLYFTTPESLDGQDTDTSDDVYLRDGATLTLLTDRVQPGADAAVPAGMSSGVAPSPDGKRVVFGTVEPITSTDNDTSFDTYLRDLEAGTTTHISDGPSANDPNSFPGNTSLEASKDLTRVVVYANVEALLASDSDTHQDAYMWENGGHTHLSDRIQPGPDANAAVTPAGISDDGSRYFFRSAEQIMASDTDGAADVYERFNGATYHLTDRVQGGDDAGQAVQNAVWSADGKRYYFATPEPLVAEDDDDQTDIYLASVDPLTGTDPDPGPDPDPDPDPTPTPTPDPVPTPPTPPPFTPPGPGPTTPPATTPTVAQLVSLPSTRRCASRRKFTVRVRSSIRGTVSRVTIFLNGRRVKTVSGSRVGLPIDLRGLPKGRVKVRLRVQLTDGRTATDTRTYRTCATKKRRGRLGRRRG